MAHTIETLLCEAEQKLDNNEKVYIWENANGIVNNWAVSNKANVFKDAPTLVYDNIHIAQTAIIAPALR